MRTPGGRAHAQRFAPEHPKSRRARDTGAHPQGGVGEGVWWVTDAHPRLREREKVAAAAAGFESNSFSAQVEWPGQIHTVPL